MQIRFCYLREKASEVSGVFYCKWILLTACCAGMNKERKSMATAAKKTAVSEKNTTRKRKAAPKKNAQPKRSSKNTTGKQKIQEPVKRDQHREVWVVVTFFLSLILLFAMLGVDGGILTPLSNFLKGLFGFGAYILPFSVLASCVIIVFAHGKPIAVQLACVLMLPVLVGMLAHLIFADVVLDAHVIPTLYQTGKTWASGGVISGGLAALMAAGISNVLSIVVVFILLAYAMLRCINIRVSDIIDFFVDIREESQKKRFIREEYEYENTDNLPRVHHEPPAQEIKAEKRQANEEQTAELEKKRKRRLIDIPLDDAPPVIQEVKTNTRPVKTSPAQAAKEAESQPESTPLPLEELLELERETTQVNAAAPTTSASQILEPIVLENTAPLPDLSELEPQPLSDEEAMEERIGLVTDAYSVQDAQTPDTVMDKEMPSEREESNGSQEERWPEEKINHKTGDDQRTPLPAKEVSACSDPEPNVLDTHQLVTETVASPIPEELAKASYDFPPVELLKEESFTATDDVSEELRTRSHKLADTLQSFGVQAQISNVIRGPSVTRYEILLDRGVKISRLTALQDDIALALGASGVRIAAIPDKSAVGIEVPNKVVQTVFLREVLTSRAMSENKSKLAFALGKDITGASIIGDIAKMPHMLIAGTTGSGKSVCINSIIISLLYRASPDEVRLIMVDPKMVELGNYNGIPHLLVPVVTDYKKAAGALNWAVMEMERRYKRMFELGARDLDAYNSIASKRGEEVLPRVVIIIDELADLMMMAAKEIEESVCRIAQKARAAGMHLIIATQRPSADVLTGLMKSNIPSRIAFAVASQIESRIILDQNGAEKLIGRGDMLYNPLGIPKPLRVQGCYLSAAEVEAVTEYIKQSGTAQYSQEILDHMERSASEEGSLYEEDEEADDRLDEAIDLVIQSGQASASMLQRKLKLGYARAGRLIDQMESRGIIGPSDGAKPRQVLLSRTDWAEMKARRSL